MLQRLCLTALLVLGLAGLAHAQAPTIGPGTPCTVSWTNPTTNADNTPLTVPLLTMNFYLDPPAGGPVIGTTRPTFSAPVTNGAPGASNTVSVCRSMPTPITTGPHTGSLSFVDAGGESAGTPPAPFAFIGIPSGIASGVTFR